MPVIVLGCGRSGTNILLEVMRGNSHLKATDNPEDKRFASSGAVYPLDYLSKCDTWYCTPETLKSTLERNPQMLVLWSIRNPKDMCLSKIRRGQPKGKGGDVRGDSPTKDSTPQGCMESIEKMLEQYQFVTKHFPDRVLLVRMEDVILDTEAEARRICEFVGIPFEQSMVDFPARMRVAQKKRRYGNAVDKSQVDLWKRWPEIYDGFFQSHSVDVEGLFKEVAHVTRFFNYEE